jgi:DNA (cytosine-5)-methyltransferase 1
LECDLKIGALCAGYGGLEMAVQAVFLDARPVWFFENGETASKILAHRYPDVPNYGDITKADWHALERVDGVTAGFPCQDISNAGLREGINGSRSGIWKNVVEGIGILRPRFAFLENVAAIRGRGLSTVAEDLAEVGYDLKWTTLRASDVEAAHNRLRWFGLATPADSKGI